MNQPLPPVPESLRALAGKQLAAEPLHRWKSVSRRLGDLGRYARRIQENIIQRVKPPGSSPVIDGGWGNQNDWQLMLGEFDKAVLALRAAWYAVKDTDVAVQQVLASWRSEHNIAPGTLFTEESEEIWVLLMPEVMAAWGTMPALVDEAYQLWHEAMLRYFHLLQSGKYVAGPLTKAGVLDDCRQLQPINRLLGPAAAA